MGKAYGLTVYTVRQRQTRSSGRYDRSNARVVAHPSGVVLDRLPMFDSSTRDSEGIDTEPRTVRALTEYHSVLDDVGPARGADGLYTVVSQSGKSYTVDARSWSCTCPDKSHNLGVKRLLVAAPATAPPDVQGALTIDGGHARALFDALGDTLNRLDGQPVDTAQAATETVARYRGLLYQQIGLATAVLVEYVRRHGADVVAFEGQQFVDGDLEAAARGGTKAGEWLLPTVRERATAPLEGEGYRVVRVDHHESTQRCHHCGALADVGRGTIRCENPACPVERVCRDRSAAATIARRAL